MITHSLGVVVVQIQAARHATDVNPTKEREARRRVDAVDGDVLEDMHEMGASCAGP